MEEKKYIIMKYKNIFSTATQWCAGLFVMGLMALATPGAQAQGVVVNGSVFGGGNAADVSGNTTVLMDGSNATVVQDIYGGGAKADVGALNDAGTAATTTTTVTVLAGTVQRDVYGGGLGTSSEPAMVNSRVQVNIGKEEAGVITGAATIQGNVFGCNNVNGTPKDTVQVDIWRTAHTVTNTVPVYANIDEMKAAITAREEGTYEDACKHFAIQGVYGGGNEASYVPVHGTGVGVYIHNCENTVKMVYGGGRAAAIGAEPGQHANATVDIEGGHIDTIFAGGDGHTLQDPSLPWNATTNTYRPADINGNVYAGIHGGYYTAVFAGSNTSGTILGDKKLTIDKTSPCSSQEELIGTLFGGGNKANIAGNSTLTIACGTGDFDEVYGGANMANIAGSVTLNIYGGTFKRVFGGSKGVSGGASADITGDVTLNLYGGTIIDAFGGSNYNGNIGGTITVNVLDKVVTDCELHVTNLYGAGNETEYSPSDRTIESPIVNVIHIINNDNHGQSQGVSHDVFGGGLGLTATVHANPVVNIGYDATSQASLLTTLGYSQPSGFPNASVGNNVYGGGSLAPVDGNTAVNVRESHTAIKNTVYGAGKGDELNPDAAIVKGNATVTIDDGNVYRSVYGGGELSSVGTFTEWYTEKVEFSAPTIADGHVIGEPKTFTPGTGLTSVYINGGRIGLMDGRNRMPDPSLPTSNDDYGYVFCAGKGIADSTFADANGVLYAANRLAIACSTYLEMKGGVVTASVYGGSENGQVLGNTHVKIKGGQIGVGYEPKNDTWDAAYSTSQWDAVLAKVRAGTFENSDAAGFHFCDAWPYNAEGTRYTYDYFAKYLYNGQYYYDENHTQPSYNGSNHAGDGHSYFGHVFGGGSGYYPFAPGVWRRTAGRVLGDTKVEITGGHILTNVYGGNEITDVLGKSTVIMIGGTLGVPRHNDSILGRPVNCNLFGAGMGDPRTMFNKWSNVGSTEVVVGGDAVIFGSVFGGGEDGHVLGDASTTIKNSAVIGTTGSSGLDGNVYGGGRGFSTWALTAGVVCGNVSLTIQDSVKIHGSVYGGGRLAAVGTHLVDTTSALYGTLITTDADAGIDGADYGNITITITGGTIGNSHKMGGANYIDGPAYSIGDVFGGSKGTLNKDVSKNQRLGLTKNTTINISQPNANKPTHILGNVYGGGEIASVGRYNYATAGEATTFNSTHGDEHMVAGDVLSTMDGEAAGLATITINGGTIGTDGIPSSTDPAELNAFTHRQRGHTLYRKGGVFGGCLGMAGTKYSGYSFVTNSQVTINGGVVVASVFGGGENGHVYNSTNVTIHDGRVGQEMDPIEHQEDDNGVGVVEDVFFGNVYGGGRGIDTYRDNNSGPELHSITAGRVRNSTTVIMDGGRVTHNIYGGGSLASVGYKDESGTGTTTVTITDGIVGYSDGHTTFNDNGVYSYDGTPLNSSNRANIQTFYKYAGNNEGNVYGSGRGHADAISTEYVKMAFVKNTHVTIGGDAQVRGSVFGGGENGHVRQHTNVTIADNAQIGVPLMSIVDWGVDSWKVSEDGYVDHFTLNTGKDGNKSSQYYYQHEGLGSGIHLHEHWVGENGEGPTIYRGNVYGGGRGVTPTGDGTGSHIDEHEYSATAGRVYGNATVTINGGHIYHDVFGGGSLASVGTLVYNIDGEGVRTDPMGNEITGSYHFNQSQATTGNWGNTAYSDYTHDYYLGDPVANTGLATVTISGGIIGTDGINNGGVFGSGRGIAGTNTSSVAHLANANNTEVYVSGDAQIRSTVFGGGANGHVLQNTYVEMTGGTVGVPLPLAVRKTDDNTGHGYRNYTGNVYGGGRGVSIVASTEGSSAEHLSVTAGRVFGNTKVEISGGLVYHSVFGGGSLASVGSYSYRDFGTAPNHDYRHLFIQGTGQAVVHITGTAHIGHPSTELEKAPTDPNDVITAKYLLRTHVDNPWRGKSVSEVDDLWAALDDDGKKQKFIELNYHYLGSNSGMVFGSGRGVGALQDGTIDQDYINSAFTRNTIVIVDNDGGNKPVICGSVFGGGENGHVKVNTHVDINGGIIGGIPLHDKSFEPADPTQNGIDGDNSYHFSSNTDNLTLTLDFEDDEDNAGHGPAVYRGNVYGGGRGVDHSDAESPEEGYSATAGRVYGNVEVNVTGGMIYHHVFGGGSLASVGTYVNVDGFPHHTEPLYEYKLVEYSATHDDDTSSTRDDGKYAVRRTGFRTDGSEPDTMYVLVHQAPGAVTVNVSGGQVGVTGINEGSVFGGGRGIAGRGDEVVTHLAYCLKTDVNIASNAKVRGSVFGGGANGHVLTDAAVTMTGGIVGAELKPEEKVINSLGEADIKVYHGNVYGGGRGVDPISSGTGHNLSYTAGRVYGNATVDISGGTVRHNVYGGGSLATVGTIHYRASTDPNSTDYSLAPVLVDPNDLSQGYIDHYGTMYEGTGNTTVTIRGNAVIGSNGMNNGSVFGSCRGVAGPDYNDRAYVYNTTVTINGDAQVHGSVFGSGENGHVQNNTTVTINGGIIGSDISSIFDAIDAGTGDYASLNTDEKKAAEKKKYNYIGNVYGAGRGVDTYLDNSTPTYSISAGYVRNSTTVNINGGTIYRSVYGGGSMGLVGDYGIDGESDWFAGDPATNGLATVNILSSVGSAANVVRGYGGNVYGSSRGVANDPATSSTDFADMAYVFKSQVNVGTLDGTPGAFTVYGNVYGGGEAGHVDYGGTTVNILSGTVAGSVFGGGQGATTSPTAGIVDGPTQVNIGDAIQYGNNNQGPTVGGYVFGGNDAGSSPLGVMQVDVYHTAHSGNNIFPSALKKTNMEGLSESEMQALKDSYMTDVVAGEETNYALKGVYGGGNRASTLSDDPSDYTGALSTKFITQRLSQTDGSIPAALIPWPGGNSRLSKVIIHQCEENTVQYVYGGGKAANTYENEVLIEGGRIYQAFAGGDGSEPGTRSDVETDASLTVKGGIVYQVFGGSNTSGVVNGTASVSFDPDANCPLMNSDVFGGGNQAEGRGDIVVNIPCGTQLKDVYGCSNMADFTGNVTLNVFGGTIDNLYGGAKQADIKGNVTVNVFSGKIGNVFGGNNAGGYIFGDDLSEGNITVNIDLQNDICPTEKKIDFVYGGGNEAAYQPDVTGYTTTGNTYTFGGATFSHNPDRLSPVVNVISGYTDGESHIRTVDMAVFGGGYGSTATVKANPKVVIGAPREQVPVQTSSVWTGVEPQTPAVEDLPVRIGTAANANGATLMGDVFGGGNAAAVEGNTLVVVKGNKTKVWNNVYGGGNAAAVSGNTDVQVGVDPQLIKPVITVSGSNFTITGPDGADLYYTTDGTMPTTSSATVASGSATAIPDGATAIKAIAVKSGMINSAVAAVKLNQ